MNGRFFLILALLLFSSAAFALGESPAAITGPHAALSCKLCHKQTGIMNCDGCHNASFNPHPVYVKPSMKTPDELPLSENGEVVCRTCHLIHGGRVENAYLRSGRDHHGRRIFCYKCHEGGMAGTNPHDATGGLSRCLFCHSRDENGKLGKAREPVNTVCRFCHGVADAGHADLLGINLPPEKREKTTCATCHEPHGTSSTIYFLRPEMTGLLGRAQEAYPHGPGAVNCRLCHTKTFAEEIKAAPTKILYNGNLVMLCLSCHVTLRAHHPTGVELPAKMATRLSASNLALPLTGAKITCYTCHDNNCQKESPSMTTRHYSQEALDNSLCWGCHDKKELAGLDPHTDDPKGCAACHETRPAPGVKDESALMASPTMLCIRCHEVSPHPGKAHHVGKIQNAFTVSASLPLGAEGEMTCTTCHDPHYKTQMPTSRLRMGSICRYCH